MVVGKCICVCLIENSYYFSLYHLKKFYTSIHIEKDNTTQFPIQEAE